MPGPDSIFGWHGIKAFMTQNSSSSSSSYSPDHWLHGSLGVWSLRTLIFDLLAKYSQQILNLSSVLSLVVVRPSTRNTFRWHLSARRAPSLQSTKVWPSARQFEAQRGSKASELLAKLLNINNLKGRVVHYVAFTVAVSFTRGSQQYYYQYLLKTQKHRHKSLTVTAVLLSIHTHVLFPSSA